MIAIGDRVSRFFIVKSGEVEILDYSGDEPKTVTIHRKAQFTGEITHLTGTPAIFRAVARGEGTSQRKVAARAPVRGERHKTEVIATSSYTPRASHLFAATHCRFWIGRLGSDKQSAPRRYGPTAAPSGAPGGGHRTRAASHCQKGHREDGALPGSGEAERRAAHPKPALSKRWKLKCTPASTTASGFRSALESISNAAIGATFGHLAS